VQPSSSHDPAEPIAEKASATSSASEALASADAPASARAVRENRWLIPPRSTIAFAVLVAVFIASALTAIFQQAPADIYLASHRPQNQPGPDFVQPIEVNPSARAGIATDLHALYVMPDGKRLWAAGAGREIWRSDDGGRRWTLQYPRAGDVRHVRSDLVDWVPLPAANADAVKDEGPLGVPARAPDYGSKAPAGPSRDRSPAANPVQQTARPPVPRPTASAPARAASAPDTPGLAASASTVRVPDAPVDLLPEASPANAWLSIQFDATGNTGWAVGSSGAILATVDGGDTWRRQTVGDGFATTLRSVAFLTPDDVWIVGDDGVVLRSRNRGRRWQSVPSDGRQFVAAIVGKPTSTNPWGVWFAGSPLSLATPRLDENLAFVGWRFEDTGREASTTQANLTRAVAAMRGGGSTKPGNRAGVDGALVADELTLNNLRAGANDAPHGAFVLQSLVLGDSGEPTWAAGSAGLLLKRASNGWASARIEPTPDIRSIAQSRTRLWAAGEGGLFAIDTSSPGRYALDDDLRLYDGRQWAREASPSAPSIAIAGLRAMQFIDDHRGWAVGRGGAILATNDGEHWHWLSPATGGARATYHVYPSPLALLGLAGSLGGLLWLARRARLGRVREPAGPVRYETGLDSDQPLRDLRKDKLGHATTVKALSAFIRNIDTEPRLTIAITAPWGQGKSSVMRMLQSDLEGFGYRTAWFNAWHHQQEGRPLTALFGAIGAQALPGGLVPRLWMRFRLIWKRGLAYRLLVVASLAVGAILAVDAINGIHKMREEGTGVLDALEWRTAAALLDRPRVVLTEHSLQALDPCNGAARGAAGGSACVACPPNAVAMQGATATGLRARAYCYARSRLLWQSANGDYNSCEDVGSGRFRRCEFKSPEGLVSAIENGIESELSPGERKLVIAAGETLPPPSLLPFTEKILPGVAIVLGVLLTKGLSVYGIELLKPVRLLLSPESRAGTDGKEASGVIEKYRTQFGNLAGALKGRLVIFIDDLDRCRKETVNSVLEMSNYLTDVGECFLVLGADLEIIKRSLTAPDDDKATPADAAAQRDAYASRYLRKLIHVEVPVPATSEALARTLIGVPDEVRAQPPGLRLPAALDALWSQLPRLFWTLLTVAAVAVAVRGVMHYRDSELQVVGVSTIEAIGQSQTGADTPLAGRPLAGTTLPPASSPAPAAAAAPPVAASVPAARGAFIGPVLQGVLWLLFCAIALAAVWLLRPGQAARRLGLLRARVVLAAGGSLQTHDPQDMQDALDLWHEIVYIADGTPRGSRRYRNKSRLFGMLLTMQFTNHLELRASVHAAALVALNFVSPGTLAVVLRRAGALQAGQDTPVPAAALVGDARVHAQLARHEALFGPIPGELVRAFQTWAATIQVR